MPQSDQVGQLDKTLSFRANKPVKQAMLMLMAQKDEYGSERFDNIGHMVRCAILCLASKYKPEVKR